MPTIKITKDILAKALTDVVLQQSFGVADLQIVEVQAFIPSGEVFPIEGIYLQVETPSVAKVKQVRSDPTGRGKIKLATVDGERK